MRAPPLDFSGVDGWGAGVLFCQRAPQFHERQLAVDFTSLLANTSVRTMPMHRLALPLAKFPVHGTLAGLL